MLMLAAIRIIGLGIWVAIPSLAISALFYRHGTEEMPRLSLWQLWTSS